MVAKFVQNIQQLISQYRTRRLLAALLTPIVSILPPPLCPASTGFPVVDPFFFDRRSPLPRPKTPGSLSKTRRVKSRRLSSTSGMGTTTVQHVSGASDVLCSVWYIVNLFLVKLENCKAHEGQRRFSWSWTRGSTVRHPCRRAGIFGRYDDDNITKTNVVKCGNKSWYDRPEKASSLHSASRHCPDREECRRYAAEA